MLTVLVISMPDDISRRKLIANTLTEMSIPFSFVDAVIGKSLPPEIIDSFDFTSVIARKRRNITRGEIGCTLSHIKAYRKLIELEEKYALILEDDVIIDHRFACFYKMVNTESLNIDPRDLFILGGQNGIDKSKFISRSYWYSKVIGGQRFKKTIKSEEYIFRTCCYIVTDFIAMKLLELSNKTFFIADEWAYFKTEKIINDIYLSDMIDHPIDLSQSHIECERIANAKRMNVPTQNFKSLLKKILFVHRVKEIIKLLRTTVRRFYL